MPTKGLVLRSDPRWKGLQYITPVYHIVHYCYECGAPIVWLKTRKGNRACVSPEQARGVTEFTGAMSSHGNSCPVYKKPTGKNIHPLAHTVPDVNVKYERKCFTCGDPDCYSHNPYQFASRG